MKPNLNSSIQLRTTPRLQRCSSAGRISPFLFALVLACLALIPKAQAVVPPPDGGYPGFNTAEGQNALLHLTTGTANTALGWLSLKGVTTESFNTAVGAGTLFANTADGNTAIGAGALLSNTTGGGNTANGAFALLSNSTGAANTAYGYQALFSNTTAIDNVAIGYRALFSNTGEGNTAVGSLALRSNIEGGFNTATGAQALYSTTGGGNTANGWHALRSNTTGNGNTATGDRALQSNTTGEVNTATGGFALFSNTTGNFNTAIGDSALDSSITGDFNTALGANAGINVTTASDVIAIGSVGANVSNSCFIGHIRGVTTAQNNAVPVLIDSAGQLGTTSSSRRYKKEIKPMDQASEAILALNPVTFHYKSDSKGTPQFGLIAEDVAEVSPDLVVRDADGEIYTVRYEAVNAMLLNEFLKEHRKVKNLETTIRAINGRLAEQAAQIQKVSAQLELSKSTSQTVLNNH